MSGKCKIFFRYCYMNELNMVVYDHEGVGSSSSSDPRLTDVDNSKVLLLFLYVCRLFCEGIVLSLG